MQDVRCLVGWHNYVQAPKESTFPRVEGRLAVECTRCHRGKNIRIPKAGASGPLNPEGIM